MQKRGLSRYEQETSINFSKGEALAYIFTYEKTWQQHLEKRLGLKPIMDNGYGGKEYVIDKKRIRPPRAPVKLSAAQKAKLAGRFNQEPVLRVPNANTLAKSDKEKWSKGRTINQQLGAIK